jgi:hypothetical protein
VKRERGNVAATKAGLGRQSKAPSDLDSNMAQLAIVSVAVENAGQFHHLRLLINRIDDPILALRDSEPGKTSIREVNELLGIWRARRSAETENLEENLSKVFRVTLAESFEGIKDGL